MNYQITKLEKNFKKIHNTNNVRNTIFCISVRGFSDIDNMRSERQVLTSGYTSYQQIIKPLGMDC